MDWNLSQAAHADLDDIADYTAATWGAQQIEIYLYKLFSRLDWAVQNPALWRERGDLSADLFSISAERHEVFFRVDASSSNMNILRILHQQRNYKRQLEESS